VYQRPIEAGLTALDMDVHYIEGGGIGVKGKRLKEFIRDDVDSKSSEISNTTGNH
jgi:hypothetical protein